MSEPRRDATRRWEPAAGFCVAGIAALTPIANLDLPWHLSAGRYVVAHGAVPAADFLSWTEAGRPWMDFEWGFSLLAYALHAAGGNTALWVFKAAVFAGLLALFAAFLRLRELPGSWIGLALPPFALSLVAFVDMRPEIFSYFFCLAQLHALEARRVGAWRVKPAAWLLGHFALYALWVNLHAGYPLGLALCLMFGAGEAAEGRRDGLWFAAAAAGTLGCLLNPYGPRIFSVFLRHWEQMSSLRHYVLQWGPANPRDPVQLTGALIMAFSFAVLGWAFATKRRAPYAHWLAVAGFGVLAALSSRQAAYFSIAAFPLALPALYSLSAPAWWPRGRAYVLAAGLAILGATGVRVLRTQRLFTGIDATGRLNPAAACDFLKRNRDALAALPMYNSWNYGGALGYALSPDYKVFMDGRYLFTEFLPLIQRALASPTTWQIFLNARHVDLVIVEMTGVSIKDPTRRSDLWRPIDVYFMPRRDWALVYWDSQAVIWVRRSAAPAGWLKDHEFRWIFPGDTQVMSLRVLGGALTLKSALEEVARYVHEIGDPAESAKLLRWADEIQR